KEIVKYMKHVEKCTIYDEDLDQEAILNKINEQDVIIGTRLHSLILALVARKPVIGVSYHHKVSDFMDEINCSNNMIPIDELHQKDDYFVSIYGKMKEEWKETKNRFELIFQGIRQQQPQGMDLLEDAFPSENVK